MTKKRPGAQLTQAVKRVLVTGASRGVGAATAKAFARAGYQVVVSARNESGLNRVKADIEAAGGHVEVYPADLSSRDECRALAKQCNEIDVLINNAAYTGGIYRSPLEEADDFWDLNLAVTFFAPLILMQELGRGMMHRGHGVVVNISSMAAQRAVPLFAPYSVAKSALDALSKSAGMDLARFGIRVNAIALGHVDTEAFAENCSPDNTAEQIAKRNAPLGRLIKPEEIAGFCLYLASDIAAPIVGAVLNIDGGPTAGMYSFSGNFSDVVSSATAPSNRKKR